MYGIQQASRLTGVSKDMIRHYEKLGLVTPQRGGNNYRAFTQEDLMRLVMIRFLNNLGVGLRTLALSLRGGEVAPVLEDLRAQEMRLMQLEKTIAARKAATRAARSSFELLGEGPSWAILPVMRRFLYSRDGHSQQDYVGLCQRITQMDCFYQYYHLQRVALGAGAPRITHQDAGLMLYDPLPFDLPGAVELPAQRYYQAAARAPRGKVLDIQDLAPHLAAASEQGAGDVVTVLAYQLYESDGQCVVCIEIPLRQGH